MTLSSIYYAKRTKNKEPRTNGLFSFPCVRGVYRTTHFVIFVYFLCYYVNSINAPPSMITSTAACGIVLFTMYAIVVKGEPDAITFSWDGPLSRRRSVARVPRNPGWS